MSSTPCPIGGYYQVGQDIFANKYDALLASTRSGVWPRWHFFHDIWKKQNWQQQGPIDLYTLYRSRARYIREKYQYICLSWSGGSDSTTALRAFVDSGIFVDEIMIRWPVKGTSNLGVHRDPNPCNIMSEWQLTILPLLRHYQKLAGARTQISIIDWTDEVTDCVADENLIWQHGQGHLNPSTYVKHRAPSAATMAAIDRGLSTAIVYGVEKPQIRFGKNVVYCCFIDSLAHTHVYPPWDIYAEFFYWSPDFPIIVPAQASVVYQYLLKNPHLLALIDDAGTRTHQKNDEWNQILRTLIYPDYAKEGWFQANKPTSWVMDEIDHWMFGNALTKPYVDSWHQMLHNRFATIKDHFLGRRDNEIVGFLPLIDGRYFLGPAHIV